MGCWTRATNVAEHSFCRRNRAEQHSECVYVRERERERETCFYLLLYWNTLKYLFIHIHIHLNAYKSPAPTPHRHAHIRHVEYIIQIYFIAVMIWTKVWIAFFLPSFHQRITNAHSTAHKQQEKKRSNVLAPTGKKRQSPLVPKLFKMWGSFGVHKTHGYTHTFGWLIFSSVWPFPSQNTFYRLCTYGFAAAIWGATKIIIIVDIVRRNLPQ